MRLADEGDIAELIAMGRAFHASVAPSWQLSEQGLAETLLALMEQGYVARTERGFIAGIVQPNPIAADWLVAKEFLWWAEDGNGLQLRRGLREWARKSGADEIHWSCPAGNERVKRLYARTSTESEAVFSEVLTCV